MKYIQKTIILFAIISLGLSKVISIQGKIVDDKTLEPLLGANVIIQDSQYGASTDADGIFFIENANLNPGRHKVLVMYIGYENYEETILVGPASLRKSIELNINLKSSAVELKETEVRADKRKQKKTEAPASIEIISSRDIKRESSTNIGSYLKGLKGVDFTSSGVNNYSISVRGFNSSFSSRLLTLTDGRLASVPSLRVVNYSLIPQSMDDVEKIEVVLGPATALYGANAHSGVVNIISKSPSSSPGIDLSYSKSYDNREISKLNGRWAYVLNDVVSWKISGMYLKAYEWEYMSELEHSAHLYPWAGTLGRENDGKDNNPWNFSNTAGGLNNSGNDSDGDGFINDDYYNDQWIHWGYKFNEEYDENGNIVNITIATDEDGNPIRVHIGDGEYHDTGDPDNDGFMGEDWYNGYDDDGDGLIDEDYFYADGIDNGESYVDSNDNGEYDDGEPFYDWNYDGQYTGPNDFTDENIDVYGDAWYDGYDNDGNGLIDDTFELSTANKDEPSNWVNNLVENNIVVYQGRSSQYIDCRDSNHDGQVSTNECDINPWYDASYVSSCNQLTGSEKVRCLNVMGDYKYDENLRRYIFDIWTEDSDGDGIYDSGNGCFNCQEDEFDYEDLFRVVKDSDGDGIDDYPDFEVKNKKLEARIDFDFTENLNMSYQTGYTWSKTQQVTGIGRFITEGWETRYHQLRGQVGNVFIQTFYNQSSSGTTRNYITGQTINDKSEDVGVQVQHNFDFNPLGYKTNITYGFDYLYGLPKTFGSILNDGPNGFDNDGDKLFLQNDNIDNDGDGLIDEDGGNSEGDGTSDGVDEPDEFVDLVNQEYGLYFQTKTNISPLIELITAARVDHHDQLDEGMQFGPKIGLMYHADEKNSWRFTYGKAFNTPSSTGLHTDYYYGKWGGIFNVFLKGNKDGRPYPRSGQAGLNVVAPGYYIDSNNDGMIDYETEYSTISNYNFEIEGAGEYAERVEGAPYFYYFNGQEGIGQDWYPLDTANYLVYIGDQTEETDGVLYTPLESFAVPDIEPIKSEKIQTVELGYKGFLFNSTMFTADYYLSYYEDFFSPATLITPIVINRYSNGKDLADPNISWDRDDVNIVGVIPTNSIGSMPPYGTAWDGIDNDGDWVLWADEFGWWDDKNGDGNPADPGEWGLVDHQTGTLYNPSEVMAEGGTTFQTFVQDGWEGVGVDEQDKQTGQAECELIAAPWSTGSEERNTKGFPQTTPPIYLSNLNYGEVWMQGIDIGFTHIFSTNLLLDGNISWYNTTDFFNELTKQNDPINAPKFKWNFSLKWQNKIFGDWAINYRHVDGFKWKDGIWSGYIESYDLVDIHFNYPITDYLKATASASNVFDKMHNEMIGGAMMGRSVVFRIETNLFND